MKLLILRLLAVIFALLINSNGWTAQNAVIRVNKAYVYSDLDMSTIIGYIPSGRQVRVGQNPKNQNSLLPIIVSGKVGYIKISDLLLEADNPHLKAGHDNIETENKLVEEHFFQNAGIALNFFPPGADFSLISERANGASAQKYAKVYRYYTTFELDGVLLRASLDQFVFSEERLKFSPLAPALDYLWPITTFAHHHHLNLAMGAVFPLSFNSQSIWGIRITPEYLYDLPYKLQLLAALEYHYYKASGANPLYFSPDTFIVNNFGFNLGLQYRF